MAEPLFVNELHADAASPSASDAFAPASLNVTTVLESPLPNALTDLAEHVARLAERDAHAGLSHRPLVWAGVRFGRGLSDQGAAHETLEHGLDVVRDTALQALEGRAASSAWTASEQRLSEVVVIARRAARLGFHARMLEEMGAWDSAMQELLRQATPPAAIPQLPA